MTSAPKKKEKKDGSVRNLQCKLYRRTTITGITYAQDVQQYRCTMYSDRDHLANLMSIKVNVLRQEIILYGASEESGVTEYHWTLSLDVAGWTPGSGGNPPTPPLIHTTILAFDLPCQHRTQPHLRSRDQP